ncbi:MAG: hypothetical protein QM767_15910 [Anaeromyxobacter sp.]
MAHSQGALPITGIGLASSLGVDAVGACAAARAGITRVSEGDGAFVVLDREAFSVVPVAGMPVGKLTTGFAELGRWVRLGGLGLGDLLRRHPLTPAELAETAVLLALPGDHLLTAAAALRKQRGAPAEPGGPTYQELVPYYRSELPAKLFRAVSRPAPAHAEVFFEDEPGFLRALVRARQLLEERRVRRCLVGGIDSLLERSWLDAAFELGLLKTATRPTGFMPGEAAAFLLLEGETEARRAERPVLARLEGIEGRPEAERGKVVGSRGRALAELIGASLRQASRPCSGFYCNLNGDSGRAQEWGFALVRLPQEAHPAATLLPTLSFGETRSAFGPLAACMAVRAFARKYAPSDSLLVWLASEAGGRGSFVVTRERRA